MKDYLDSHIRFEFPNFYSDIFDVIHESARIEVNWKTRNHEAMEMRLTQVRAHHYEAAYLKELPQ